MRHFFIPALAALGALAACGPDEAPPAPKPHGCFEIVRPAAAPQPGNISTGADGGPRAFLGEFQPAQEIRIAAGGVPGTAKLELIGPILSQTSLGASLAIPAGAEGGRVFAAPSSAGSYRLQATEVGEDGATTRILGEMEIVAVPVSLCGSSEVGPTGEVIVVWTGPGDEGDIVDFYDPVMREVLLAAPGIGAPYEVNATRFIAPAEPGAYTIRYVKSDGVVQTTFDVVVAEKRETGRLRSPATARSGEEMTVQWIGPPRPGHLARIRDAASGAEVLNGALLDSGSGASSAILTAPAAGDYTIEYSTSDGPAAARSELSISD